MAAGALLGALPVAPVVAQEAAPVVVAGGPAAVPEAVLDAVRDATDRDAVRVAGGDRFETAAAIAAAFPVGAPAFVATGGGFADALAGGPAAAVAGGPRTPSTRFSLTSSRCRTPRTETASPTAHFS